MAIRRKILNLDPNLINMRAGNVPGWNAGVFAGRRDSIPAAGSTWYTLSDGPADIAFPAAPVTVAVASTSVLDTAAGMGARAVAIQGLDENYELVQEVIVLAGQTAVNSVNTYIRVNTAQVVHTGSLGWNQGEINIGDSADTWVAGAPTVTGPFQVVQADENMSLSGVYTVPANQELYLSTAIVTPGYLSSMDAGLEARTWDNGFDYLPWYRLIRAEVSFGSSVELSVSGLAPLPPRTDLRLRIRRAPNTAVNTFIAVNFALKQV